MVLKSFSVSVSLSLPVYVCLSLSVCLPLSLSVNVALSPCLPLSLSLSLCLSVCLSVSVSVSISVHLRLSPSVSLLPRRVSVCLCPSLLICSLRSDCCRTLWIWRVDTPFEAHSVRKETVSEATVRTLGPPNSSTSGCLLLFPLIDTPSHTRAQQTPRYLKPHNAWDSCCFSRTQRNTGS